MLTSLRSFYYYVVESFFSKFFSKSYLYNKPYIQRDDFWMIEDVSSGSSDESSDEENIFTKSQLIYSDDSLLI